MIKIDLITGFLGSGKTTFIKKYAKYLVEQGERVCILENDYGAINIDMVLLNDLLGPNCELEMVVGGDGHEAHQRRFRTKLISISMLGYTRVIVEPSGIYDVDEFFDTLYESPLDNWYEVGSIISVMDPEIDPDLSEELNYILVSETANAGKIVLSKLDKRDGDSTNHKKAEDAVSYLNDSLDHFRCKRRLSLEKDILLKDWQDLDDEDFRAIAQAGYVSADHVKLSLNDNNNFQSLFYLYYKTTEADIRKRITDLMSDPAAGNIIRIKGFLKLSDKQDPDSFIEINATKGALSIRPIHETQEVIIIIGENLCKDVISGYFPGATTV